MATQRVKVEVKKLIAAMDSKRKALEAEYAKQIGQYETKKKAWASDMEKALKAALAQIAAGKLPLNDYGSDNISFPSGPRKPNVTSLDAFDRDIAVLKLSADEHINISTDSDWARYL